ncbi:hypothetical protein [Nostoc sp.]|uniref:hypothetical protein n=1 Tax=Nostoc sp. TaxID=1180 RepID=UPI002FF97236
MQLKSGSAASLEAEPQRRAFPVGDWERDNETISKSCFQACFHVKLTPMSNAVPLRQIWFKYMKTAAKKINLPINFYYPQ